MIILKEGSKLGRYELIQRLGRGAFAEVWKAKEANQHGFQKFVALKILKDEGQAGQHREALIREARLCANLRHPNIVDVLGVETDAELVFVAMEFVDGGTLEELIQKVERRQLILPRSVVVDIGLGIARAIHRAHHFKDDNGDVHQIIHRDLKPSNILLSRAGLPKVADFGLAKINTEMTATATGKVKGTPAYIAPEIWKGGREFLPTCDLFAVGCMLYEMVMLSRLFDGETVPAVFGQQVYGKPAEEANRLDARFPEMVPIVEALLQRDPDARIQEAAEVIENLNSIRPGVVMAGEIEDFLELLKLSELPDEDRLTSTSSFRIPAVVDTGWHDLIHAATGKDVPYTSSESVRVRSSGPTDLGSSTLSSLEVERPSISAPPPVTPAEGVDPGEQSDPGPTSTRSMIAELPGRGASAQRRRALLYGGLFGLVVVTGLLWFKGQSPPARVGGIEVATVGAEARATAQGTSEVDGLNNPSAGPSNGRTAVDSVGAKERDERAAATAASDAKTPPSSKAAIESPKKTLANTRSAAEQKAEPGQKASVAQKPSEETKPTKAPQSVGLPEESAAPQPSPAASKTVAAQASAAAGKDGCLVLTSSPAGAKVWLDGVISSHRARRSATKGVVRKPGPVQVQMGMGSQATAAAHLSLTAGQSHTVHCNLLGNSTCTVSVSSTPACKP